MVNIANADLRLLRVFTTVVKCNGFSAAQAELNISQSTISNHMIALEERLRLKLCQRGRSGFALTDHGRTVFEASIRLFEALEEFSNETESLHSVLTGSLRVGIVDNTVTDPHSAISSAFLHFSARPNNVNVNLVVDSPPGLQKLLVERQIDLAIFGFVPRLTNLHYQDLYPETSTLFCGRGHPLFDIDDDDLSLDAVRDYAFASRSYWCNQDLERIGTKKNTATVEQVEAQLLLVLSGAYLAFLPNHYAQSWVDKGELRPLLPDETSYSVWFQLATRKGIRTTPTMKAFIQDVHRAVGEKMREKAMSSDLPAVASWQSRRPAKEDRVALN
ncbi:LysR family transcriptional regulator [Sagittula stellata]|uniref:Transcriptional regulator, LysR family protein n=1 Tax=Sagittula stellata (strain ATCC 700073 / DSM 11524 / E-37) TaxID=388399 RepID=A3K4T4_SAGS3|nr:LysR family transcriptional regulator [Sagittula stellata]EBA07983.1 transcriptional regulator, LysR family protein [Sagittula stellata E-37]